MALSPVVALAREHVRDAQRLIGHEQLVRLARQQTTWRTSQGAYRARLRQERAWVERLTELSDQLHARLDVEGAIELGLAGKSRWRSLLRQGRLSPQEAEVRAQLVVHMNEQAWEALSVQAYVSLAMATSAEAGQWSLDRLGLNRTFTWAHPRAMARDLFAVRGSKVIQGMYGNHLDNLAGLIVRATDPLRPLTIDQVRAEIAREWPKLRAYQVERIARTETAAVWQNTALNTYRANGITQVESLLAQGPSIPEPGYVPYSGGEYDVAGACPICVEIAAQGFVDIAEAEEPPFHPNCRCELIPYLGSNDDPWLPPDEPCAGEQVEGLTTTDADW